MNIFSWAERKIQKFKWYDISIFKLCMFAFTLMLAKLWAPLLQFEWHVYGIVFLVTYIYLAARMLKG